MGGEGKHRQTGKHETDGQRARDMKSYRSGNQECSRKRVRDCSVKGAENIPTFPFLSVPLTTLMEPQGRGGGHGSQKPGPLGVGLEAPCLGPQGAGRVGRTAQWNQLHPL